MTDLQAVLHLIRISRDREVAEEPLLRLGPGRPHVVVRGALLGLAQPGVQEGLDLLCHGGLATRYHLI